METFAWVFNYMSEKKPIWNWTIIFIGTFSLSAFIQEPNLLPDCAFRPFTYVCCEDSSMPYFSAFSFLTHFV